MPAIASTTAPTTSPSSATWPSISFARSRQRAPCASRSSGRDGRTHSSPKSSLKFEMRLPWGEKPLVICDRPRLVLFGFDDDQKKGAVWTKHLDKLVGELGSDRVLVRGNATGFTMG